MSSDYYGSLAEEDWDDEPCDHDHEPECMDYNDEPRYCTHEHCIWCGACRCPGYCDDHQTYNLRPDETGGTPHE